MKLRSSRERMRFFSAHVAGNAGFDEKQAETVVRVLSDAQERLVTREHFDAKLESMELRLTLKIGALVAAVGGIIIAVLRLPH